MTVLNFNAASKKKTTAPGKELKPVDPFDLKTLSAMLGQYKPKVADVKNRAIAHIITDDKSNEVAIQMGIQVKTLLKAMKAEGKSVFSPYDRVVKGIKAILKPFESDLKTADESLTKKRKTHFLEDQKLKQRIAAKKAKEDAAERQKVADKEREDSIVLQKKVQQEALDKQKELDAIAEKEGVEPVTVEIPEVIDPGPADIQVAVDVVSSGPVRTAGGGVSSYIPTWKYTLVDIDQVPDQFTITILDNVKVNRALKNGVRSIPGLDIFEDVVIRDRANGKDGKF